MLLMKNGQKRLRKSSKTGCCAWINPFSASMPFSQFEIENLYLAFFFVLFILFVLTVFRFGEWLLFMQQPFEPMI